MSERFGTWRLESVIAVGGLGEIWRASRGRDVVALKRLHTHLLRNDAVRAQFTVEQHLTSELPRHANVVHGVEAGELDGRPYIALELAPGEDLRRVLAPAPRSERAPAEPPPTVVLPRARVLAIVLATCEAAAHLHDCGFVHGDINPGNLVVSTSDHVTLIDLGIARKLGASGVARGTHAYMAPEQVRGEPWGPATDVFAIGVVLWELIAGARLFHRGPPWLSMAAVVEAPAPPLDDPELDAIARAALHKDPEQRTASPAELAERLGAL